MKNSQFEVSPETAEMSSRIIAILIGVNDEISDVTLERIIGVAMKPNDYALQVALRTLHRADPPVCFRRRRGVGWKRETDTDLVQGSEGALKKVARSARRGSERLGKVQNFHRLTNDLQIKAATNQTKLFVLADTASVKPPRRAKSTIPDLLSVLETIKQNGKRKTL